MYPTNFMIPLLLLHSNLLLHSVAGVVHQLLQRFFVYLLLCPLYYLLDF